MSTLIAVLRWLLALFFIIAGANHFRDPALYLAIMPPYLPWPEALNAISGAAEIAGGIGILIPATRRLAGYGLIALLIAVLPANIHMAVDGAHPPGIAFSPLVLWLRLPFQVVFIAWVWLVACRRPARRPLLTSAGG